MGSAISRATGKADEEVDAAYVEDGVEADAELSSSEESGQFIFPK